MAGIEETARVAALEFLFSPAADVYVSLLEVMPVDGVGEVEISPAPFYARESVTNWATTSIVQNVTTRENVDAIPFGPYTEDVIAQGWGIYDAVVAGNLLASGPFVDGGFNQFGVLTIPTGDDFQFQSGGLSVSIGPDCPIVVAAQPPCPAPSFAFITLPTMESEPVPIGGPPVAVTAGTNGMNGQVDMDITFDGSLYDAEILFDGVPQILPVNTIPAGPSPHTGWEFDYDQPAGVGVVVSLRVTEIADETCTWTQPMSIGV